jgi:hypothetical protein
MLDACSYSNRMKFTVFHRNPNTQLVISQPSTATVATSPPSSAKHRDTHLLRFKAEQARGFFFGTRFAMENVQVMVFYPQERGRSVKSYLQYIYLNCDEWPFSREVAMNLFHWWVSGRFTLTIHCDIRKQHCSVVLNNGSIFSHRNGFCWSPDDEIIFVRWSWRKQMWFDPKELGIKQQFFKVTSIW